MASRKGTDNVWARLNTKAVQEIREKYATGEYTLLQLGTEYEVHYSTVYAALKGFTWVDGYSDELRERVAEALNNHARTAPTKKTIRKVMESKLLNKKEGKRIGHVIKEDTDE